MLILTRRVGESLAIGDQISFRVMRIKGGRVCIGIHAPSAQPVHRKEVCEPVMRSVRANGSAPSAVSADIRTDSFRR
ncbi:carbon storage regulator [Steroidobacter flavus]|uniref:Translational regulator CsrA n=1 Tax=Steroidobacter flavus TaxID=1842136 RepID=A0ABV8SVQ3_9GAMM